MTFDLADYEAKYASHYGQGSFEPVLVAARRRQVLASIGDCSGKRVLEVGCGLEPLVVQVPGASSRVIVEPAGSFVAAARTALGGDPASVVIEGFLEDSVASEAALADPFDVVIVSSLLHEVPDPVRLLSAVRQVCGPDAQVHINVPNVRSFHRLLAREMGLIEDLFTQSETERRFQRHTRFDMETLVAMVTSHGFAVRASGSYFVKPFTHDQMHRAVIAGVIDAAVLAGLERMTRHLPGLGAEIYVDVVPA